MLKEIPAEVLDPELAPHLLPVWNAFAFLSPSRPMGMEVGAIPLTEILAYLDEHEVRGEWRADMVALIRDLDNAFREHCRAQSEKKK